MFRRTAIPLLALTILLGVRAVPEPTRLPPPSEGDWLLAANIPGATVGKLDLVNEDPEPYPEAALPDIERMIDRSLEAAVTTDNIGRPVEPWLLFAPRSGGQPPKDSAPVKNKDEGEPFAGRSGAAKAQLLKQYGGTPESEKAVALGLAWLAKQQKEDGCWAFDQGGFKEERAAATGFALLAFLGAGESHTDPKSKHKDVVNNGLEWLKKATPVNGASPGRVSMNMYAQGIATLALAEAYGVTRDPALKPVAQAAVNYLQQAQGRNGSWGYSAGTNGDTSIVGWQVQALSAARQAGLAVDEKVLKKAVQFLDFAAAGGRKAMYGYQDNAGAAPGTALTAVGLWSRVRIDNWGGNHPGIADGLTGLMKNGPLDKRETSNMYYYYYATQVVRHAGGDNWKTWNEGPKAEDGSRKGGMRDWLVSTQNRRNGPHQGSWDPEAGWFGQSCGRLGTTAVCLLTLEVYYRYAPTEPTEKKGDKPDAKKAPDPQE